MELTYDDLSDGIRTIKLKGRMDFEGTAAIDLKFTSLTAAQRTFVVVDLTEVDFRPPSDLPRSRVTPKRSACARATWCS
jgi:hypothetical protein